MLPTFLQNNSEIGSFLADSLLKISMHQPENFIDAIRSSMAEAPAINVKITRETGDKFIDEALQSCEFTRGMQVNLEDVEEVEFPDAAEIIHEGDAPDYLYILVDGLLTVLKQGQQVNVIEPGEVFGELAFMFKRTRTATVVAQGPAVVCRIPGARLGLINAIKESLRTLVVSSYDDEHTPYLRQEYLRVYVSCHHVQTNIDRIVEIRLYGVKQNGGVIEIGAQTLEGALEPYAVFQVKEKAFVKVVAVAQCLKHGIFENQLVLSWE